MTAENESCMRATLNLLCLDGVLPQLRHLDERILEVQDREDLRTAEVLVNAWVALLLERGGLAG